MVIDRERVKNTFAEYTSGYNATDPKIKLKIDIPIGSRSFAS